MKSIPVSMFVFAFLVCTIAVFAQDSGVNTTYGKKLIEFTFDPVTTAFRYCIGWL